MPKVWENEVSTLKQKGMPESMAYAIATKHFKNKYGMTPQEAKRDGFEPEDEKKAEYMYDLEIVAALGARCQADEKYGTLSDNAQKWADMLTNDIVKIAADSDLEDKDDKKRLKYIIGATALAGGIALGLRGRLKSSRAQQAMYNSTTENFRALGKTLSTKSSTLAKIRDDELTKAFASVEDPRKRDMLIRRSKDMKNIMNDVRKNALPHEQGKINQELNTLVDNIRMDKDFPQEGVDWLRGQVDTTIRAQKNNSFAVGGKIPGVKPPSSGFRFETFE